MAIQVRRGNESDFDASKMLPGEWAVSLDTRYVRMCFAPGVVLRMATYEGFEADKAQFQAILAECRSIQEVVRRIGNEVSEKASLTIEYSNSAKESAERAKIYADNAEAVTGVHIATNDRAGLIKGGDNYIAEDGTLMLITATTSTTQPNSYAGREHILEIGGVTEQGENPSPDNPQEIKKSVVSGVRTHGKNFLPYDNNYKRTVNGITVEAIGDGYSYKVYGTASSATAIQIPMRIASKEVCTFSSNYVNSSNGNVNLYYTENGSTTVKGLAPAQSIDLSNNTISALSFFVVSDATVDYVAKVQLEEGTVATEYEPYQGKEITFSQPIELYGNNGVQDVITPKEIERKYYSVRANALSVFDASAMVGNIYLPNNTAVSTGWNNPYHNVMSNMFADIYSFNSLINDKTVQGLTIVTTDTGEQGIYFRITSIEQTLEAYNAFLANTPIEVVLERATPTTEALPIADKIGLNSLATYDGITYVEFDSEIQPTFKAEYGTSKVGGYTLEGLLTARNNELRLTAVENAVVNNI